MRTLAAAGVSVDIQSSTLLESITYCISRNPMKNSVPTLPKEVTEERKVVYYVTPKPDKQCFVPIEDIIRNVTKMGLFGPFW